MTAGSGASGAFSILRFAEQDLPDVVFIEQLTNAVYLDQRVDVEHYLEVADQLSGEALPGRNPAFLGRAVRYLSAEAGIHQFLDIYGHPPNKGVVSEGQQTFAS